MASTRLDPERAIYVNVDDEPCVRDDSTECDCWRCTAAQDRFWREQGEEQGESCVDPAKCCFPHPDHGANECSFTEGYEDRS